MRPSIVPGPAYVSILAKRVEVRNMAEAVVLIEQNMATFEKLIEAHVLPQQTPELLVDVLAGKSLKYIIDFTDHSSDLNDAA